MTKAIPSRSYRNIKTVIRSLFPPDAACSITHKSCHTDFHSAWQLFFLVGLSGFEPETFTMSTLLLDIERHDLLPIIYIVNLIVCLNSLYFAIYTHFIAFHDKLHSNGGKNALNWDFRAKILKAYLNQLALSYFPPASSLSILSLIIYKMIIV